MESNDFETIPDIGRIHRRTLELHVNTGVGMNAARKVAQRIANDVLGTVEIHYCGTLVDYCYSETLREVRW